MKNKKLLLLLLPILILAILPINTSGGSFYNGISGALFCDDSDGCLHEIGHRMDDELGYPSRSPEFGNAIMIHLAFTLQYGTDDFAVTILAQDGLITYSRDFSVFGMERFSSPQEELYAKMYEISGGNIDAIPMAFREFYSTDEKYAELYNCLMDSHFNICGTAIHYE